MKNILTLFFFATIISSCSTGYEVVNTYKNLGYAGNRLFPIKTNFSAFSFRIWISNSTSIDRVISIWKDSAADFQGSLIEYGKLFDGKNYKGFYNDRQIVPKDGFEIFLMKLDSLHLLDLKDKPLIDIVQHEPFSTYVIEIKDNGLFNTFRFDTNYPNKSDEQNRYTDIEKLIFEQFDIKKLYRLDAKGS